MRTGGNASKRNAAIDFLRFVFAVVIVLHHSRYVLGDENCIFLGGSLAVEFFFFVSGYLMMQGVEKAEAVENFCPAADGSVSSGVFGAEGEPWNGVPAGGRHPEKVAARGKHPEKIPAAGEIGTETFHFILRKIRSFLPEFLIAWGIGFLFVAVAERYSARKIVTEFMRDFWELTLVKMSGLFLHGLDGVMWYLSAMLLSMAILYPLIRRHRDVMTHLVCPLLCLFLYGYLCRVEGHPRDPVVWLGFAYKGLIRGFAGISVGIVIWMEVQRLRRKFPNGLATAGAIGVTALELICLGLAVRYMALRKPSEYDYFYMFLLMILVLLCFSGLGIESKIFTGNGFAGRMTGRLAKYSLSLYLSHLYFAQHMDAILPAERYPGAVRMAVYLVLAAANGLLVMALASMWRKYAAGISGKLRKLLTADK